MQIITCFLIQAHPILRCMTSICFPPFFLFFQLFCYSLHIFRMFTHNAIQCSAKKEDLLFKTIFFKPKFFRRFIVSMRTAGRSHQCQLNAYGVSIKITKIMVGRLVALFP